MICACGCAQDEHTDSGTGPCDLSIEDKKHRVKNGHLCGGFEASEEEFSDGKE